MTTKHWLWMVCILFSTPACAEKPYPKILYVYDGDTVKVNDGHAIYKLRITDIDAPERNQSYGKKSRRALIKLCEHAEIDVILEKHKDKYKRRLGQLYCNAQSVSHYMAANGHAWSQGKRYTKDKSVLVAAKAARAQQLGLWAEDKPMPPWKWRKRYQYKH